MTKRWIPIAVLLATATVAVADPTPKDKAEGSLAAAEIYTRLGEPAKAETFVAAALAAAPLEPAVQSRAEKILKGIVAEQRAIAQARQRALLDEADRLAAEGKIKEAGELIRGKLDAMGADLIAESEARLDKIHRRWLRARLVAFLRESWVIDALLALALIFGLTVFLSGARRWVAWWHRKDWLVTTIDDATKLGLGLAAFEHLSRWAEESPAGSAGLLKLDSLSVQPLPRLEQGIPGIDLTALGDLPSLGEVNLGAVAKAVEALRRQAHGRRQSLSIAVYATDQQVEVRLTRKSSDGKIQTVAASGANTTAGSAAAAASASFKMYYLLAYDASMPEAGSADQLRLGLDQLREYITGRNPASLHAADETIRQVLSGSPGFETAQLYEGVVLDLRERHEEAESLFRFLAHGEHVKSDVKTKALYNLAVTKFRKYRPEELRLAIEILNGLIGPDLIGELATTQPRLDRWATSPIQAMAVAAKANAIAHQPIWWQTFLFGDSTEDRLKVWERKSSHERQVFGWIKEVERLTDALVQLDGSSLDQRDGWDPLTRTQLLWSCHNARGNINLNIVFGFLKKPHIHNAKDVEQERTQLLEAAYREFETCKMLLPPGVETLTNLATTLLNQSRTAEASQYAEAATKLNPDYEYAYYRLAQAWEEDGKLPKVIETLESYGRAPTIPSFKSLFEIYKVAPKPA
jgi:tetratricopeptide (TPR) repeat protein